MTTMFQILTVLATLESGNDPSQVGRHGDVGILQIRECVVQDVNRIYRKQYRYPQDCRDIRKSKEIANLYLTYWGRHYQKDTGRRPTEVVLARIWNSGPNGWKSRGTLQYGKRFQRLLKGTR